MTHLEILQYLNKIFNANFYLVGGFVRDLKSGIFSQDYDIATDLKPEQVLKIAQENNIKAVPTGLKHGTVTLFVDSKALEVTTFRKDLENNGRHAKVEFSKSIKQDSLRRDFTINAIYLDANGLEYDFHSGLNDLKKGRVRFIGNPEDRINEDYLRILRFFRFFADFDNSSYSLRDEALLTALENNGSKILELSADRITQEILKTAKSNSYTFAFKALSCFDSLKSIFKLKSINLNFKSDEQINKLESFKKLALLYRSNLEDLKENKVFNFSNKQKKYLSNLINLPKLYINEDNCIYLSAKHGLSAVEFLLYSQYADSKIIKLELSDMLEMINQQVPEFEVSGSDLIKLGFAKNKTLGESLSQVKKYWLENNFADKDLCLDFARKILKKQL